MTRKIQILGLTLILVLGLGLVATVPLPILGGAAWAAQPDSSAPGPNPPKATDSMGQIFEFVYTISHKLGQLIMSAVKAVFPTADIPSTLVDAIGFLSLLTVALVVAEIAKKLVWIVVGVGWLLIAIRIGLIVVEGLQS